MKLKYFKLTIILSVISIVVIPLIIVTQFLYSHLKSNIENKNYKIMETIRDEKITLIESNLKQNIFDFQNTIRINSSNNFSPDIKNANLINSKPFILQVVNYNFNFKPLSNLKKTGYTELNDIPENLRITLQNNFYFSSFFYKDQINAENYPILVLFTKDNVRNEYYTISLDYQFFDNILQEYSDYQIDLYNSKYQIVSSSLKNIDPRRVNNNKITERMSLGFKESVVKEGKYYSYSHISLNDEELYLLISIDQNTVLNELKNTKLGLLILYFTFFIVSIIVSIFITKHFYNMKEKDIQNEIFSDKYSFFYRLRNNLDKLDNDFNGVKRLNTNLNYLKNDLEVLMNNIPDGVKGDE